ncbi:MAG: DUF2236 domain-containing protein [Candidatus Saccharibacteria bacterium]|nr:DUF2236 domain-containing protein [Moraxellaceae bacterium]
MIQQSSPTKASRPNRARSFAEIRKAPLWMKALTPILGQELTPNETEYDELVKAVSEGDVLMDNYVAWMFASNPKLAKQKFDQALQHGLDSVEDCPDALRVLFQEIERVPAWLDRQLLNDALAFIHSAGKDANHVLRDAALMGGYLLSGFNRALILTGALNQDASKRIAETSKWWMDCTEYGGLERFAAGFKSTVHVRFIHALVRRNLAANPEWDSKEWGLPICQIDMAATNLAFGLVFLAGLRALGIFPTSHESRSVMHLWKYAGWLMGVEKRWLVDSEREGIVLLHRAQLTQSAPDWSSQALGQALSLEPLQRHYAKFPVVSRQFAYYKHLSINQFFLGGRKMAQLGLPSNILPWYPLLVAPLNMVTYSVQRILPPLHTRLQQRGRKAQRDFMGVFGDKGLTTIRPDKNHPAHV